MSLTGIVLAQTFCAAPFLIVAARSAFGAVDPAMLDVASTLGHSEFSRFRRVALPIAAPGIRAGMLLAWLRAFGEYGAVIVLAYHPFSLPVYTYNQFSGAGLPTTIAPTALALGVAVVVVALSRLRLGGRAPSLGRASRARCARGQDADAGQLRYRLSPRHVSPRTGPSGERSRLAVLGPSGSGKSALLRCLVGSLRLFRPGPSGTGRKQ